MITPDEEVRVIVLPLPREEWGWVLTPAGEAALDASLRAKPTVPMPRTVADEAREMARKRADAARQRNDARAWLEEQAAQNQEIDGTPPTSL